MRPDDGKIIHCCAEWATPMSDDPPVCKSNGFALHRKPKGGRITLNAASICGISVYHILIGGHQCHSIGEGYTRKALLQSR